MASKCIRISELFGENFRKILLLTGRVNFAEQNN